MKFMDKVKNLFTEEDDYEPIKKDVIHVEIPSPKENKIIDMVKEEEFETKTISIKNEELDVSDLEKEEKKPFPVYFDDEDFNDDDYANKEEAALASAKVIRTGYHLDKAKEIPQVKKEFHPSPIISPVYGVLDKNYKKDDVGANKTFVTNTTKTTPVAKISSGELTLEDVRRKAFGTLEDQIEHKIFEPDNRVFDENINVTFQDEKNNLFDELEDMEEIDFSEIKNLGQISDREEDAFETNATDDEAFEDMISPVHTVKEETKKSVMSDFDLFEEGNADEAIEQDEDGILSENDLFNLIDSMYEKDDE